MIEEVAFDDLCVPHDDNPVPGLQQAEIEELEFEEFFNNLVLSLSDTLPAKFFTLQSFIKRTGLSETTARRRLQDLVINGTLKTKLATVDGYQSRIYWRGEE